jgi:hypothetical protein
MLNLKNDKRTIAVNFRFDDDEAQRFLNFHLGQGIPRNIIHVSRLHRPPSDRRSDIWVGGDIPRRRRTGFVINLDAPKELRIEGGPGIQSSPTAPEQFRSWRTHRIFEKPFDLTISPAGL